MYQTQHIFTYLNIFLNIIYLWELYLNTFVRISLIVLISLWYMWGRMLISGRVGNYRMCVSSQMQQTPKWQDQARFIHFLYIVINTGCHIS